MVSQSLRSREPRCLSCLELSSCVSDFLKSSASMSMLQLKYLLLGPFQGQLRLANLNGSSPQQNIQQDQFGMQQSMQYGHQQYGNSQYGQPYGNQQYDQYGQYQPQYSGYGMQQSMPQGMQAISGGRLSCFGVLCLIRSASFQQLA